MNSVLITVGKENAERFAKVFNVSGLYVVAPFINHTVQMLTIKAHLAGFGYTKLNWMNPG